MFVAHSKFGQARVVFCGVVLALAAPNLCLALGATQAALNLSSASAQTVAVGACLPKLQTYSTISQAVAAVSPGSTVLVCPGTYPEQITITQPLTLRGVQSGNASNPVVTVPPGGLTQSIALPPFSIPTFFQILVKGTEGGMVNINGLAVDGANNLVPSGDGLEGIYYLDSSGVISGVAVYGQTAINQAGDGFGVGIEVESTTSSPKTFTVGNSSIHDFGGEGIFAAGGPKTLTVNILSNSVVASNSFAGLAVEGGIYLPGGMGSVLGNNLISHPVVPGPTVGTGISIPSNVAVSGNTIVHWDIGVASEGDSNTITSNTVSLATFTNVLILGANNKLEHNFFVDSNGSGAIDFDCKGTGNTVINNVINEMDYGIASSPANNTVTPNSYSNVKWISEATCR